MKPVILMTGHTMPELSARRGDFDAWYGKLFGWKPREMHVVDAIGGEPLPNPGYLDGLVVSVSACSVLDYPDWSVKAGKWILEVMEQGVPVLAICYGHQLIADALGGVVAPNPAGREIGVCAVTQTANDPLFADLPREFAVIQTHVDAVLEPPKMATELAMSTMGRHQALAFGPRVRSVQWHPEFDADVIRHYIRVRAELIDAERGKGYAQTLEKSVRDVDSGAVIARNFLQYFMRS